MKSKKNAAKCECVKVAIRVRPMNKHEIEKKSKQCVDVDTTNNTVSCTSDKNETKTFQFDYVYPMDTTQREVYDQVAFPIVESIFQGYNGTVFAYGQTGCGKTFTMMGVVTDPNLKGIIPNAFSHIFGFIKSEGESKKFLVRCSFVEIYNEEVRDLLGNKNQKLDIREDPKKGTFVKDLTYVTLKDTNDIEKCLEKGNKNRHVGATSMNDQSSRSHSLFTVYVEIEETTNGNSKIRSGKLNLVDLAGSERVGKTNATGQTFDEGKKINLSLTALGSVIDALSSNRKHIPYKDSKLTRLLADSLGGNTKTVMFANISPASYNYEETVGTLRYASRAKLIKNAPKINEDPKDALLRKYEEEIKALKEQLANGGGTKYLDEIQSEDEKNYDDFVQVVDDPEKDKLIAKIKELEQNLIDNKKLEQQAVNKDNDDEGDGVDKEEIQRRMKEQEEENKKFKEYREMQFKQNQEMEEKYKKLQEDKLKEEELLKNDVNRLQQKIKELNSEIEDLKGDRAKDREEFMASAKGISRNNDLYRGIIKFLLTDKEFTKIMDASKYIEEDDQWKVHPFAVVNKSLSLPTVNPAQVQTFIDGNINKRDLIIEGFGKFQGNKKLIFSNYGNENNDDNNDDNNDFIPVNNDDDKSTNTKYKLKLRDNNGKSKSNFKDNLYGNESEERVNFRKTKEKYFIDSRRAQANPQIAGMRKTLPEPVKGNKSNLLMSKKEREIFENLGNNNIDNKINKYKNRYGGASESNYGIYGNYGSYGKVALNPLCGSNNKLQISYKDNNFNNESMGNMLPLMGNVPKLKLHKFVGE